MAGTPSAAADLRARIASDRARREVTLDQLAVASSIDSSHIRGHWSGHSLLSARIVEALDADA